MDGCNIGMELTGGENCASWDGEFGIDWEERETVWVLWIEELVSVWVRGQREWMAMVQWYDRWK